MVELTGLFDRLFRSFWFPVHYAENFVLAHNQILFPVDRDVAGGILAEQDVIADLNIDRNQREVVETLDLLDGDDLSLLRLLLGVIEDNNAAAYGSMLLDALHRTAIEAETNMLLISNL